MLTIPNFITLLRFPLALAFFQDNPFYRGLAILLAMLSDGLDGYIARRYGQISRFGTLIDPIADKIFVLAALFVFISEGRILAWEAATMLCRDVSIVIFGVYLSFKGTLSEYQFRAIICGKLMTTLQFIVLLGLAFQYTFPILFYFLFIAIGASALVELYMSREKIADTEIPRL